MHGTNVRVGGCRMYERMHRLVSGWVGWGGGGVGSLFNVWVGRWYKNQGGGGWGVECIGGCMVKESGGVGGVSNVWVGTWYKSLVGGRGAEEGVECRDGCMVQQLSLIHI